MSSHGSTDWASASGRCRTSSARCSRSSSASRACLRSPSIRPRSAASAARCSSWCRTPISRRCQRDGHAGGAGAADSRAWSTSTPTCASTSPSWSSRFDRDRAEDLGVPVARHRHHAADAARRARGEHLHPDNKLYDVILRLDPRTRATPTDMSGLQVRGRDGQLVQLDAVATVEEGVGPRQLNHFNRVRSSTLSASLAPGFTLGEALDSLNAHRGGGAATRGAPWRWPVNRASSGRADGALLRVRAGADRRVHGAGVAVRVAGASVHRAARGAARRHRRALVTLRSPGSTLNLYSQIGMILLIGLVTKNSILLVEYANQLQGAGHRRRRGDAAKPGRIRLRPILMTSVATIMGALPIALGLGAGSRPAGRSATRSSAACCSRRC